MAELLTAAEMRAAERAAIDSGAVTGPVLMERAARGVVEAALGRRPALARTAHRAVVFCGPGNKCGDGFSQLVPTWLFSWGIWQAGFEKVERAKTSTGASRRWKGIRHRWALGPFWVIMIGKMILKLIIAAMAQTVQLRCWNKRVGVFSKMKPAS